MSHIVDQNKYIQTKLKYNNHIIDSKSVMTIDDIEYEKLHAFDNTFTSREYIDDEYKCIYKYDNKDTDLTLDLDNFEIITRRDSKWCQFMGDTPDVLYNAGDGRFIRFSCVKSGDTYSTSGIWTKSNLYLTDGKIEFEARFQVGQTAWPAVWCTATKNGQRISPDASMVYYYEVDLVEYFLSAHRGIDTTYHNAESYNNPSMWNAGTTQSHVNDKGWTKFVCTWDENSICCYTNDRLTLKIDNDNNPMHYPVSESVRNMRWIFSMQYDYYSESVDSKGNKVRQYLNNETPNEKELPLWMDIRNIKIYRKS